MILVIRISIFPFFDHGAPKPATWDTPCDQLCVAMIDELSASVQLKCEA